MIFYLILFLILFLSECFAYLYLTGIRFALSPSSNKYEGVVKGIERYFLQTITWITIVIGLLSLSEGNKEILFFLFLSLIFFIFSFRIGWVSGVKRLFYFMQQRLFNFSIIISYYGIILLLESKNLQNLFYLSFVGLIFLYLFELYEFKGDIEIAQNIRKKIKSTS